MLFAYLSNELTVQKRLALISDMFKPGIAVSKRVRSARKSRWRPRSELIWIAIPASRQSVCQGGVASIRKCTAIQPAWSKVSGASMSGGWAMISVTSSISHLSGLVRRQDQKSLHRREYGTVHFNLEIRLCSGRKEL